MPTIVLIRPQTPANIGFIARSMKNFDLKDLLLIEPLCNHLDEESIKISKHASEILKKAKVKKYEYFDMLKQDFDYIIGTTSVLGSDYNIPRTPLTVEELADRVTPKTAIVFGNEGNGLSNEEIGKCDFIVSIPSSKKYPALNISHAAAIVFYELYKKTGKNKINSHIRAATPKEKEVMAEKLDIILDNLEFPTKEKKETQRISWKKLFEKSMMSKREAFVVLGLLSKLEKKVTCRSRSR
ncbi:RNA methyltransferase [Candidatus Woesearchaeota archaeon]|nr:RNA methyltransferase [Candidatus Woesearchaeota archaeon]